MPIFDDQGVEYRIDRDKHGKFVRKAECKHYMDGRQIPCPEVCPYQCWPKHMFRRTIFGNWKLRWKYR